MSMIGPHSHVLETSAWLRRRVVRQRRWATVTLWLGVAHRRRRSRSPASRRPRSRRSIPRRRTCSTLPVAVWAHPFGTDELGRDVFSRVLYAIRIDLLFGLVTTYVPLVIGMVLGAIAGYRRGWVETVVVWLTDVTIALPFSCSCSRSSPSPARAHRRVHRTDRGLVGARMRASHGPRCSCCAISSSSSRRVRSGTRRRGSCCATPSRTSCAPTSFSRWPTSSSTYSHSQRCRSLGSASSRRRPSSVRYRRRSAVSAQCVVDHDASWLVLVVARRRLLDARRRARRPVRPAAELPK